MWKFNIISDFEEGIKTCGEMFQKSENPHVFSHPALLRAWYETYKTIRALRPVFITGSDDNGNQMSLPMVLWRRNWKNAFIRALVPIGYSDFDYHDPLFIKPLTDKEEFWNELISFLSQKVDYDNITIDGITDVMALDKSGWAKGEICPMLTLEDLGSQEDLLKFFKTSMRGDIRRQIRRISEIGKISLKEYERFEDIPESTFTTFMHHHSLRWPNAYKAPEFHANLLRYGLKEGCTHFSVLRTGDIEIAWHLGFEHGGRYYYYMPAGHQEYLKFSPAKIHLFFLVTRAIENGLTVFDHLRGEENYKDGWSNSSQYVNTFSRQSESMQSQMRFNLLKLKGILYPPKKINTLYINHLRNAS